MNISATTYTALTSILPYGSLPPRTRTALSETRPEIGNITLEQLIDYLKPSIDEGNIDAAKVIIEINKKVLKERSIDPEEFLKDAIEIISYRTLLKEIDDLIDDENFEKARELIDSNTHLILKMGYDPGNIKEMVNDLEKLNELVKLINSYIAKGDHWSAQKMLIYEQDLLDKLEITIEEMYERCPGLQLNN